MAEDAPGMKDVVIVGAGPAGAMAAIQCARKGLSVEVLDHRERTRASTQRLWINAAARKLLEQAGLNADDALDAPVEAITLHDDELAKSATSRPDPHLAFFARRGRLESALLDAAEEAGACVRSLSRVEGVEVLEEDIRLTLSDETVLRGRFLIGADGVRSVVAAALGFEMPSTPPCWRAQWDGEEPRGSKGDERADLSVAMGLIEASSIGYVLRVAGHIAIGVAGPTPPREIGEEFIAFVDSAREAGLISKKLDPQQPVSAPVPAGRAIELETHVGKRTLLVGDAGGFVTAMSYEGVYPALWSATIAADVLADANACETGQDVLGEFDARWRTAMADYLRMPNTDLQFLLPLVFSNQQMADRMVAAFLDGQNI